MSTALINNLYTYTTNLLRYYLVDFIFVLLNIFISLLYLY